MRLTDEMKRVLRLMHRAEDATATAEGCTVNGRGGQAPVKAATLRALESRGLLHGDVCPGVTFYTLTDAGAETARELWVTP